jgi:uncharacterized protein YhaN
MTEPQRTQELERLLEARTQEVAELRSQRAALLQSVAELQEALTGAAARVSSWQAAAGLLTREDGRG